jgi:hypothetical protein
VQTGRSAFEKVYSKPIFDFCSDNQQTGKRFDQAMTGVHGRETEAMLEACDFASNSTLADIGGGNGLVLTAILRRYPAIQGILFDLPGMVERAMPTSKQLGWKAGARRWPVASSRVCRPVSRCKSFIGVSRDSMFARPRPGAQRIRSAVSGCGQPRRVKWR